MTTRKTTKISRKATRPRTKAVKTVSAKSRAKAISEIRQRYETPAEMELLSRLHRPEPLIDLTLEGKYADEVMTYRQRWGFGGLGV